MAITGVSRKLKQDTKCVLCNFVGGRGKKSLSSHVTNEHNLTFKEYYDKNLKLKGEDKCRCCDENLKFRGFVLRYGKYCDNKCQIKHKLSKPENKEKHITGLVKYASSEKASKRKSKYFKKYHKSVGNKYSELAVKRNADPKDNMGKSGAYVSGYHKNTGIYLKSSYEFLVANGLDELGIKWDYEKRFKMPSGNFILTDFVIPEMNLILEVRPLRLVDDKLKNKIKFYKDVGYNATIFTEEHINNINESINKVI